MPNKLKHIIQDNYIAIIDRLYKEVKSQIGNSSYEILLNPSYAEILEKTKQGKLESWIEENGWEQNLRATLIVSDNYEPLDLYVWTTFADTHHEVNTNPNKLGLDDVVLRITLVIYPEQIKVTENTSESLINNPIVPKILKQSQHIKNILGPKFKIKYFNEKEQGKWKYAEKTDVA